MSRFNQVFKPLFIDTFEYSYTDGKTEKSFTIKKKSLPKNGKSEMQKSEPLAQFNNETIQQNHKRAQTSRWQRQSSCGKNSTINSGTPNNGIRKIESRFENELTIPNSRNSSVKRNNVTPQFNYVNFNLAVMNGEASNSFTKALDLINKDNKLMRKQKKQEKPSKTVSTQSNEINLDQMEQQYPKEMIDKIGLMLAISEKQTPVRKQSRIRETFTRNLKFLDQSFQESASPDKKLKSVIESYFDKKKAFLEEQTKKQEIELSQFAQQTKPNRNRMRISTTFLKQFVNQVEEETKQNNEKVLKTQRSISQSVKSSSKLSKKKQNAIFSGQVRAIFKKMFHLIVGCVRKMKQMKITTKELFQNGVFQKKPYEREGSFQFFEGVENNNIALISFMLQKCRYYAFDVNEEGKTPLHISSSKGYQNITERLLLCGSFIDSQDNNGKTPLYYAISSNQINIVSLLLYYKANPWSNKKCSVYTTNYQIMNQIKKARKIHLVLLLTKHCERDELWKTQRDSLIL